MKPGMLWKYHERQSARVRKCVSSAIMKQCVPLHAAVWRAVDIASARRAARIHLAETRAHIWIAASAWLPTPTPTPRLTSCDKAAARRIRCAPHSRIEAAAIATRLPHWNVSCAQVSEFFCECAYVRVWACVCVCVFEWCRLCLHNNSAQAVRCFSKISIAQSVALTATATAAAMPRREMLAACSLVRVFVCVSIFFLFLSLRVIITTHTYTNCNTRMGKLRCVKKTTTRKYY